jgi:hypothetical protein
MSSVVISGDTSGAITVTAPAVAGTYTQTLPMITGTLGTLNSGTAVASTSGTSIDFTNIPANVRRITVMFNGVSTSGTSNIQMQIGSGSVTTSGYASQAGGSSSNSGVITSGFCLTSSNSASWAYSGIITLNLIGSNIWIENGNLAFTSVSSWCWTSGGNSPTLSGVLDRVRITTVNGTDTFDAGSINILYE